MRGKKQDRVLEIFFKSLRGEKISVQKLADEYGVSTKSITRSINDLKACLADHRDLVGNTELQYSYRDKCYQLEMDGFLTNKELFALTEIIIGTKALSKIELLDIIEKLKQFTTAADRSKLEELIRKEIYHYTEVKHDCKSVQDNLWELVDCISKKREITIQYQRMDRNIVTHRIIPASVMFADYYFYLIAFEVENNEKPIYFRVDRIQHITEHRKKSALINPPSFDEGLLRKRSLFMWPGKLRKIRFEFTGPSVQAVLDKLPTAKIIEQVKKEKKYLIEAEVYGDGIKMWLLSQGAWVKVISPQDFVDEMKIEVEKIHKLYYH